MTQPTTELTEELLGLTARCEAATGPDRRLDGLIFARLNPDKRIIIGSKPGRFPQKPVYGTPLDMLEMLEGDERMARDAADYLSAPYFTASLDAAMTLVPEPVNGSPAYPQIGRRKADQWQANIGYCNRAKGVNGYAATPALALCAASLRARAAS